MASAIVDTNVPAGGPGSATPAAGTSATTKGRKVSTSDIQLVQNLIERCMQAYMPLKEVVSTLQAQAKVRDSAAQEADFIHSTSGCHAAMPPCY